MLYTKKILKIKWRVLLQWNSSFVRDALAQWSPIFMAWGGERETGPPLAQVEPHVHACAGPSS